MKTLYVLVGVLASAAAACGKSSNTQNYPLITPPVKAAAPAGFGGTGSSSIVYGEETRSASGPVHELTTLDINNFDNRFFSGSGPTYIYGILASVDGRISGLNSGSSTAACLTQTPVQYTITPFGQSVTMFAQCYQSIGAGFTGDPGLVQWGVQGGVFYLWTAIGAGWTAAIATPISGSSQYSVQIWSTVGFNQTPWDSGSYGVMQIVANPTTSTFEMTAAGLNIGYCGAQFKSDGTNIFGSGSDDMGTSCGTLNTICVLAKDAATTATCTAAQQTYTLPPLGRTSSVGTSQTWAATNYPASGAAITLNGAAGMSSTDSLHFGPNAPTAGVGLYQ